MGQHLFQIYRNRLIPRLVNRGQVELTSATSVRTPNRLSDASTVEVTISSVFTPNVLTNDVVRIESSTTSPTISKAISTDGTVAESIVGSPRVPFASLTDSTVAEVLVHSIGTSTRTTTLDSALVEVSLESKLGLFYRTTSNSTRIESLLQGSNVSYKTETMRSVVEIVDSNDAASKRTNVATAYGESLTSLRVGGHVVAIDLGQAESIFSNDRPSIRTDADRSNVEQLLSRPKNRGRTSAGKLQLEQFYFTTNPPISQFVNFSRTEQFVSVEKHRGETSTDLLKVEGLEVTEKRSNLLSIGRTLMEDVGSSTITADIATSENNSAEILAGVNVTAIKQTTDTSTSEVILGGSKTPITLSQDQTTVETVQSTDIPSSIASTDVISVESHTSNEAKTIQLSSDHVSSEVLETDIADAVNQSIDRTRNETLVSVQGRGNQAATDVVSVETSLEGPVSAGNTRRTDQVHVATLASTPVTAMLVRSEGGSVETIESTVTSNVTRYLSDTFGETVLSMMSPSTRRLLERSVLESVTAELKKAMSKSQNGGRTETIVTEKPLPYLSQGGAYISQVVVESITVPSNVYIFSKIFVETLVYDISAQYSTIYLDRFLVEQCLDDSGFGSNLYVDILSTESAIAETNGIGSNVYIDRYLTELAGPEPQGNTNLLLDTLLVEVCSV